MLSVAKARCPNKLEKLVSLAQALSTMGGDKLGLNLNVAADMF
jgi:hypothetical protein